MKRYGSPASSALLALILRDVTSRRPCSGSFPQFRVFNYDSKPLFESRKSRIEHSAVTTGAGNARKCILQGDIVCIESGQVSTVSLFI